MPDITRAVETLTGTPQLTDELRDTEAVVLLRWAEAELKRLAAQHPADAAAFDADVTRAHALVNRVNRLVGKRTGFTARMWGKEREKFTAAAAALGYTITPAALDDYQARAYDVDDATAMQTVLGWLTSPGEPVLTDEPADTAPDADVHLLPASVPTPPAPDVPPPSPAKSMHTAEATPYDQTQQQPQSQNDEFPQP